MALAFNAMNGQTKKRKVPGDVREVLALNLNRLMEQRYQMSSNRPMSLAKDTGVSLSTVQRTLSREAGASIDTVEAFAKALIPGLPAFQLLVPWGMLGQLAAEPARYTAERPALFRGNIRQRPKQPRRRRTAR